MTSPWTDAAKATAKRLWAKGWSSTDIAATLRTDGVVVTRNAVIGMINRAGLQRGSVAVSETQRQAKTKRQAKEAVMAYRVAKQIRPPVLPAAVVAPVVFAARGICKNPDGCEKPIERGSYCAKCASRFYMPPKAKVANRDFARG